MIKKGLLLSIIVIVLLFVSIGVHAEWNWQKDTDLLLWTYADSGIETIDGVLKWRDHSVNNNHMTVVGNPVVKTNAINGHSAMEVKMGKNEYFYVDFDKTHVGDCTIFIVANMKTFSPYNGLFSTNTPNNKQQLNTFEAYFLNNQIETGSMDSNSRDINKDALFMANDGEVFGKYHNFILSEISGESTKLNSYYGVYDNYTDTTSIVTSMPRNINSSEGKYNTMVGFSLGSRGSFAEETPDGEYAEAIVFKRALSEDEIKHICGYISDKYFKAKLTEEVSNFDFLDSLSLWLKAESYPEDFDFSGVLQLKDYAGNNNLKNIDKEKVPRYQENQVNGYGEYSFDGNNDFVEADLSSTYSGSSTIFLVLDNLNNDLSGNVFSTGGIEVVKSTSGIQLKSGNISQTMTKQNSNEINLFAVRVTKSGNVVTVDGILNNTIVSSGEYRTGWTEHSKYSLGTAGFSVGEVLVYQKALEDGEILAVLDYLSDKYNETTEIVDINYLYLDENNKPCEVITEGGSVKANITLRNNGANINNAQTILALYDGNKLIGTSVSDKYSDINTSSELTIDTGRYISLPDNLSDVKIKIMFWNGINILIPLRDVYIWDFPIDYE